MSTSVQRFLGGSPAAVAVKLIFLSLVVGALMSLLGLTPVGLFDTAWRAFRSVFDLSLETVREVGRWLLYGAAIVVPLWLLVRLVEARR